MPTKAGTYMLTRDVLRPYEEVPVRVERPDTQGVMVDPGPLGLSAYVPKKDWHLEGICWRPLHDEGD